jgi:hypothetical protein
MHFGDWLDLRGREFSNGLVVLGGEPEDQAVKTMNSIRLRVHCETFFATFAIKGF